MATRYRQRRLMLLVILLAVTVLPIIAVGAWWMWPLLIIPAVLAAPLAGGAGLVGTLLATAIALAAASAGDVSASEITAGFVAIIVVAALGAVHAGMVEGVAFGWGHGADADGDLARAPGGLAPIDVFHLVADRDCRRAEEAGAPVALALVTTPRLDAIITDHGRATATAFLDAAGHGVARVIAPSDLVVDMGDGRFMALVAGDDRIIAAHERAVGAALSYLEEHASLRRREDGEIVHETTGRLLFARFTEHASRELDPHLHTHCVVMNATFEPTKIGGRRSKRRACIGRRNLPRTTTTTNSRRGSCCSATNSKTTPAISRSKASR